jgi:creatinine amidohydrolase
LGKRITIERLAVLPTRRLTIAAVLLAIFASPVFAEVETERMTWTEIRDAVAAGRTTIIIPTGGTEQNGPHMVTGKHNFIVRETARRIAEAAGGALVAPVLSYVPEGDVGTREGHTNYPGTISVPPETFKAVLAAAARSYATHGFKLVVFVGDSGPNQEPQRWIADELTKRWAADGVRAINADSYYTASGGIDWLRGEGETVAQIGSHAGIADTSEMLAVYPEGVRVDLRAADKDGVSGDPTRATAERGEKLIALKVAAAVRDIENARSGAPPPAVSENAFKRLMRWVFG